MNYRHAFHAGNFADVLKHAVLARILLHLQEKSAPFRVLDTHAGIGLYDLRGEAAQRTGEWREGVGRLDKPLPDAAEALLAPYRTVLAAVRARHGEGVYPGSPILAAHLTRPQDRAIFIEKHPDDQAALLAHLKADRGRDPRLKVLHLDGWTALNAMIPPPERRGLVLIDPPFEARGEHVRLGEALAAAARKWDTGCFIGWYPIKDPADADAAARAMGAAGARGRLRIELRIDAEAGPDRLSGCGLLIVNPPWRLAEDMAVLLPALAERLAQGSRAAWRCDPL